MNYLRVLITITVIFIIINACRETIKKTETISDIFVDVNSSSEIYSSDIFTLKDIIRIETTSDNLIDHISRLIPNEDFFILNRSLYDYQGRFIRTIGSRGRGPGELMSALGIVWIDNNTIRILDRTQNKLIDYNIDGEYLKEYRIGLYGQAYAYWKGLNVIYTETSANEFNKMLFVLDKSFNTVGSFFDFDENDYYKAMRTKTNFFIYKDSLRFFNPFTNFIINIEVADASVTVNPRYYIDFGKNNIPQSFLDQGFEDIRDYFMAINETDYAHSLNGFFENNNTITFFFRCNGIFHFVIHRKDTKETMVVNQIHDDILFNGLSSKVTDEFESYYYYENEVFYILQAYQFIDKINTLKDDLTPEKWDEYSKNHPEIIDIYNNIDVNDNPIIFVFELL